MFPQKVRTVTLKRHRLIPRSMETTEVRATRYTIYRHEHETMFVNQVRVKIMISSLHGRWQLLMLGRQLYSDWSGSIYGTLWLIIAGTGGAPSTLRPRSSHKNTSTFTAKPETRNQEPAIATETTQTESGSSGLQRNRIVLGKVRARSMAATLIHILLVIFVYNVRASMFSPCISTNITATFTTHTVSSAACYHTMLTDFEFV